jgi:hypothetical protein
MDRKGLGLTESLSKILKLLVDVTSSQDRSVIHKNMSRECIECPDIINCKPVPMVYERTANGQIEM